MAESPPVIAVILNWNGEQDTIEAVRSVRALDYPGLRTVVVDNGSRADSLRAIREALPDVECVENGRNLGYAGGNNVGFRLALQRGAEFCLILNNDLTVDPPMLRALVDAAVADPALAILGPCVYRYDRPSELFYTGWKIDWRRWLFHRCAGESDGTGAPFDVDFVQGCALLVRMSFVREHGAFDERFHLYCEDADLCVRAQRAGFRTVEASAARVWHKGYGSSGRQSPLKTYYGLRNRLLFIAKHAPPENRLRLRLQLLLFDAGNQVLRACGGFFTERRREAWFTLRALASAAMDGVVGHYGPGPDWLFTLVERRRSDGESKVD
jgi:GT2 family glycosyltransferase